MIPGKQYKPEDLLWIAWRRKWLIAIPFVVAAAATLVGARYLPNTYKSETTILVVPQRIPDSYVRATVTARIEDRLQSISQQILSRPRLEGVVKEFNLYPQLRQTATMEDVVERMRQQIDVQVVKGDSFRVSYVSSDAHTAMRVVERLASLFIDENLRDREVLAEGTNEFLEAQLEDARRRLVENEKKLSDYQRQHADELPSQATFSQQAMHNLEMQVQGLVDSINADRDRRLVLERQVADLAAGVRDDVVVAAPKTNNDAESTHLSAAEQLAVARSNLATLQLRLKPEHPDVIRLKLTITELEQKVAAEPPASNGDTPTVVISPARRARENRIAEIRSEIANLTRQITAKEEQETRLRGNVAVYQSRIQAAPVRASELAELTRDYDTLQQMYKSLLQKNEDSKVAANLERRQIGEQFKVIDPAHLPEKPFSPNRPRLYLLGAAAGLAFGLGFAVLLEYLDGSMRSEADVITALSLPVLALVPLVESDETKQQRRRARLLWAFTGGSLVLALAGLAWKLRA